MSDHSVALVARSIGWVILFCAPLTLTLAASEHHDAEEGAFLGFLSVLAQVAFMICIGNSWHK